jgi:hypothetical protein
VTVPILTFPGADGGVRSGSVLTMTELPAELPDLTQKKYSTFGSSPVHVYEVCVLDKVTLTQLPSFQNGAL